MDKDLAVLSLKNSLKVSIILTTYNAGDALLLAVESISQQTVREWELIMIDDGSCDMKVKVYDFSNVYICDGSAIPASGYSNTGLTIAALAVRLADHLKGRYSFE